MKPRVTVMEDGVLMARWLNDIFRTLDILTDILRCSFLRMLRVRDSSFSVDLKHIDENRVDLLKRARLFENARVIYPLEQRMSDGAIRDPKRKQPHCATDGMTELSHRKVSLPNA